MIPPLSLHNMMVEPEEDENENKALMDLALEPEEAEEGSEEPPAAEAAESRAEERYAQQMMNRRANELSHKKA